MKPQFVKNQVWIDPRGTFREVYNKNKDFDFGELIQINVSTNEKHVFRGMHYQFQNPQGKLVSVTTGAATDYVVDLRVDSPDFGQVKKFDLIPGDSVWVPQYHAHGFLTTEPNTTFQYCVFGSPRVVGDEYAINPYSLKEIWDDIIFRDCILSEKDQDAPDWVEAKHYV